MEPGPVVVGIDIAASRPCVAVAVRCGRTLEVTSWREADEREAGDRERLFEWLDGLGAVAVGVDAPQRPRRARGAAASRPRACDAALAPGASPSTRCPPAPWPKRRSGLYAWMETGWEYFRELGRRGFEPPAPGTTPACSGRRRRRSRSTRTPRSRPCSAARRRRRAPAPACASASPPCAPPGSCGTSTTTTTRWTRSRRRSPRGASCRGVATPLGDDRDGYIWVPVSAHEVLESYGRLSEREALAAARALSG